VLHAGDDFLYRDAREPSVESSYRSDYAWLTLEGRVGDRIRQQSVAWIGDLDWERQGSQAATNSRIVQLRIDDRRSLRTLGIKQDWSIELGSRALLKLGGVGQKRFGFDWLTRAKPIGSEELAETLAPLMHYCIEKFGPNRCMFESNFPVDKVSYSYSVVFNAFKRLSKDYSTSERAALFHDTAARVYRIAVGRL